MTGTPRWSPDSRSIVFDSRVNDRAQLFIVPADGGVPRQITTGTASGSEPFWSGDGGWIYFSDEKNGGIWKVSAEGGSAVRLTEYSGVPQESADAKCLYYSRYTQRGAQLWSMSVNGGDERPIDGMPALFLADQWVPARSGIYYIDANATPPTLNLFDAENHRIHHIADLPGHVRDWGVGLSVSGDGRTLVYAENDQIAGDITLIEGFR